MSIPESSERSPTSRRRTPAGHAIAVVLITLLVAAFVDADSLVGTIEQQPFGASRTAGLALARPVRTISHWTGLTLPHTWLDELIHGTHHRRVTIPLAVAPTPTTVRPAVLTGRPTPTTPTATAPARPVPASQQPLKVWMAGDSLMGTITESFSEMHDSHLTVTNDVQIGTGLARPDVYNWPSAVSQELASVNPDVVVLMFGANDDQDMQAGGHRVALGGAEWRTEYARRVSELLALTAGKTRLVIWLGIPAVRRPRLNQTKDTINQVVMTTATQYPGTIFVDTGTIFDGPGGTYTTYLTNAGGQPVRVRENDGIHLTLAGANRLSPAILAPIVQRWRSVAPP
jgi:hypothetical protein